MTSDVEPASPQGRARIHKGLDNHAMGTIFARATSPVWTKLGSRIAEVHNGSSLFTGDAGQGESNGVRPVIQRWVVAGPMRKLTPENLRQLFDAAHVPMFPRLIFAEQLCRTIAASSLLV
jgi:hypothetical protein